MNQDNEHSKELIISEQKKSFPYIKFSEPLETKYCIYRHQRLLKRVPTIGLAALAILLIFTILDIMTLPEPAYLITCAIRLFLVCPLIAIAIFASYKNWPISIYNAYYMSAYVISGIAIIAIIYTARINQYFLPYDGILLHIVFGYFLMAMPYAYATFGACLISIAFFIMEFYFQTPIKQLASYAFFIVTLNLMGSMGSYMQDKSRRVLFLNEQLVALSKAKDKEEIASKTRLVATASHDLRQPLHAMNLLLETLESRLKPSTELDITKKLKDSIEQLSKLLASILNISRLNAGIVKPELHDIDLAKLMEEFSNEYTERAQKLNIALDYQGPSPCPIHSDKILLERIFRNLIENVFEHADANIIHVHWKTYEDHIKLEMKDNGCGISEADIETIFEEFTQLGPNHKSGMGLGLTIVKQLCELTNINYGISSELHHGSNFWLKIPIGKYRKIDALEENHKQELSIKGNIILIDDDPSILDSMSLLLKEWGYHVASCKNYQDVWMKLKTFTPSLIISDYHLPKEESNGLELIKKIRQKTDTTIPALLITADTNNIEKQLKENYVEKEIDLTQITKKPISPAKLKLIIQYFIREY